MPTASSRRYHTAAELPRQIIVEGKTVRLRPIPLHTGYGAGDDGIIYSFYEQPANEGYGHAGRIDYSRSPWKRKLQYRNGYFGRLSLESSAFSFNAAAVICEAWNGRPNNSQKTRVICDNGDFEDLRPTNLRWATEAELAFFLACNGRVDTRRAKKKNGDPITEAEVIWARQQFRRQTIRWLATMLGVSQHRIEKLKEYAKPGRAMPPLSFPNQIGGVECRPIPDCPRNAATRDGRFWFFPVAASGTDLAYAEPRPVRLRPHVKGLNGPQVKLYKPWGKQTLSAPSVTLTVFGPPRRCRSTLAIQIIKGDDWSANNLRWRGAGESSYSIKITHGDAKYILSQKGVRGLRDLSRTYGIAPQTIQHIWSGEHWTLEDPNQYLAGDDVPMEAHDAR